MFRLQAVPEDDTISLSFMTFPLGELFTGIRSGVAALGRFLYIIESYINP